MTGKKVGRGKGRAPGDWGEREIRYAGDMILALAELGPQASVAVSVDTELATVSSLQALSTTNAQTDRSFVN